MKINRRGFLKALGLAPVAVPLAIAAAEEEVPLGHSEIPGSFSPLLMRGIAEKNRGCFSPGRYEIVQYSIGDVVPSDD